MYCTLDTETFGGACNPKGAYHIAGIIHDGDGTQAAQFNLVVAEHYNQIQLDSYAKKNALKYREMCENGIVTTMPTEDAAIAYAKGLLDAYNVKYVMAYNSNFDFGRTKCRELLEGREYIDIWLMALQTLTIRKKYADFCRKHGFRSSTGKTCSTSAETVYAYLTGNNGYKEEHTAFEDSKIEMEIFLACRKAHKHYTKNCHCFNSPERFKLLPKY